MHLDLLGIFAAGMLTFASPCILPLVPVYLGLLGGASVSELEAGSRRGRTALAGAAFSAGLGLVFVLMGMAATALGHALVEHRTLLLQLGGLLVFLFGLKFLGVVSIPWLERDVRPGLARAKGGTLLGSFAMGAAFGLGWTPCIGPVLGSVLTVAASTAASPWQGAGYLAAYAAGLALPLVLAAAAAPLALGLLRRAGRFIRPLEMVTGGLLAVVGLLLLTDHLQWLAPSSEPGVEPPAAAAAPSNRSEVAAAPACSAEASGAQACGLGSGASAPVPAKSLPRGPAMVEFVARGCPVCQRMAPVVQAAERDCAGHGVRVERVEVDAPGGRDLARAQGVLGVPTFLFLDAQGREVARLVGQQPLGQLEQSLEVLSGARCEGFRALPAPREAAPSAPSAS